MTPSPSRRPPARWPCGCPTPGTLSGPNSTDAHRPAVLCYYSRSWIKPFQDYVSVIDPDIARTFPAEVRYLLGFSARAPLRR